MSAFILDNCALKPLLTHDQWEFVFKGLEEYKILPPQTRSLTPALHKMVKTRAPRIISSKARIALHKHGCLSGIPPPPPPPLSRACQS